MLCCAVRMGFCCRMDIKQYFSRFTSFRLGRNSSFVFMRAASYSGLSPKRLVKIMLHQKYAMCYSSWNWREQKTCTGGEEKRREEKSKEKKRDADKSRCFFISISSDWRQSYKGDGFLTVTVGLCTKQYSLKKPPNWNVFEVVISITDRK